jgi:hypothetical protein
MPVCRERGADIHGSNNKLIGFLMFKHHVEQSQRDLSPKIYGKVFGMLTPPLCGAKNPNLTRKYANVYKVYCMSCNHHQCC